MQSCLVQPPSAPAGQSQRLLGWPWAWAGPGPSLALDDAVCSSPWHLGEWAVGSEPLGAMLQTGRVATTDVEVSPQ